MSKIINRGINSGKRGQPITGWIKNLPSGKYTIEQLIEFSKVSHSSTLKTFKKHGGKVTLDQEKMHGKRLYIWENKF